MKDRLREIREDLHMKQIQFAEATGKTRDQISNYEIGRVVPDSTFIQLLAVKFGYSEEWIVYGTGPKKATRELGIEMGALAGAAAKNAGAGEDVVKSIRDFFKAIPDVFTDAEILMLYQIYKNHKNDI